MGRIYEELKSPGLLRINEKVVRAEIEGRSVPYDPIKWGRRIRAKRKSAVRANHIAEYYRKKYGGGI